MAMELIVTSLQQSLLEASRVPTDIKFLFKEENDSVSSVKEVRAHKLILALVSDVFEKGLFGDIRDDGSVEIKDATHDSFEAMVNFIYNVKTDMSIYDFERLCSLYYLGEEYNINALKKEALLAISKKGIPVEEILGVCALAEQYSVHDGLKETLLKTTAQSLWKIFKGDLKNALDFFSQIEVDDTTTNSAKSLVQLIASLKKIKQMVCDNCKSSLSLCLTGVGITRENFVPGAKVSGVEVNPDNLAVKLDSLDSTFMDMFLGVDKNDRLTAAYLNRYVYNCGN